MAKPVVQVTGLTQLTKRMALLKKQLPTEISEGLRDTAGDSLKGLATSLNRAIDHPSDWIRIKPGSRKSSVIVDAGKAANGKESEASIRIADPQSAVLKFLVGGETVRRPSDVGVGSRLNWIPQKAALADIGIRLTPEGGLPRGTLAKLAKRSKKKRRAGSDDDVFFGRPKGRSGKALGWWKRPADRTHALRLLITAEHETRYRGNSLVSAWNRGLEEGASGAPKRMGRSVTDAVRAVVRKAK